MTETFKRLKHIYGGSQRGSKIANFQDISLKKTFNSISIILFPPSEIYQFSESCSDCQLDSW